MSEVDLVKSNPPGSEPLLELRGIRKSFSSVEVLRGVDFDLRHGEIHALLGHNGAGKSTLIKAVAGLYPDVTGTIRLAGRETTMHSPRQAANNGIAVIYQDFALVPDMTVAENIAMGREPLYAGGLLLSHGRLQQQSEQELREFGMDIPLDQPVRRLGVAGKQMTEIAKALAKRARILIMDEPTARLAPNERTQLFKIMRRLAASGVGIIYISHFLDEVKEVADRVTVLRDGSVVASRSAIEFSVEALTRLLTGEGSKTQTTSSSPSPSGTRGGRVVLQLKGFSVRGGPKNDLALREGRVIGIAGLVGSGRTSLVRGILGDLTATGTLEINGRAIRGITPRAAARVGLVMVPEDRKVNGLVLQASVRANLELTALDTLLSRLGMIRRGLRASVVRDAIGQFRILPPDPRRLTESLSGGNAQKVLLARAVLAQPKIMLLDQPTAGVDIGAKLEIHHRIRRLVEGGMAVLLISDELEELLGLSDDIAIMNEGVLSQPVPAKSLDRSTLLAAISKKMRMMA